MSSGLQAVGLGHGDVLLLGVDHEDRVGRAVERADAAQVALELGQLALELEAFLLDHLVGLAGRDLTLELVHLRHAGVHRLEVGEHAAEPAVVDVGRVGAIGLLLDRLLRLLLRADEEHVATVLDGVAHEAVRGVDPLQRLLEVDDVDAVALTEDEALHLRVPAPGLVSEVDAGLQQLLHGDDGCRCLSHGLPFWSRRHGRAARRGPCRTASSVVPPPAGARSALRRTGRPRNVAGVCDPGARASGRGAV